MPRERSRGDAASTVARPGLHPTSAPRAPGSGGGNRPKCALLVAVALCVGFGGGVALWRLRSGGSSTTHALSGLRPAPSASTDVAAPPGCSGRVPGAGAAGCAGGAGHELPTTRAELQSPGTTPTPTSRPAAPRHLDAARAHVYLPSDAPPLPRPPHAPPSVTIAMAAGVISARGKPLAAQPLLTVLLPSLTAAMAAVDVARGHVFRLYLAYDADDGVYDAVPANRATVARAAAEAAAPAVALTTHWVRCTECAGKPSWAHDRAACSAFVEGADYVFRINDDTVLPSAAGWDGELVDDLAGRRPVANLGVAGPDFDFPVYTPILSHDFTHWTHIAVHGYYYPPTLPNWSADDWITYVYDRYNATHKLPRVRITHVTSEQRYSQSDTPERQEALDAALDAGGAAIDAYTTAVAGVRLSNSHKHYTTT